ncbi:MAG: hydrogenase maturation nickel metallochaperone HypA [Dehalococcoidales bacterium]|nr:hydrogenase maturation nickel metallochaperone HypA [Dehalococcoidales bacterium]
MHELSITENILSITLDKARQADAVRVSGVNLVIGELSGIVGECVDFYFKIISKDTIAADAVLYIQQPPTRFRCRDCGAEFTPEGQMWECPDCGRKNYEIVSGRDLYIESIEVE